MSRPKEPGSLREEAKRRGVSLHQVRKERALAKVGQVVCPTCDGLGTVPEVPPYDPDLEAITHWEKGLPSP